MLQGSLIELQEFKSSISQPSKIDLAEQVIEPFIMVIFGGAGDLSQRKLLPTLYHLYQEEKLINQFSILGIGSTPYSDEQYRALIISAIKKFAPEMYEENSCLEFARHLSYLQGNLTNETIYKNIFATPGYKVSGTPNILFYCSVPPNLVPSIVENLQRIKSERELPPIKIIIEKPFGTNRESAGKLNRLLLQVFTENQIYRIDHYLGKDTVQNILFFRFGNSIFEPLWNRRYIDHVQIMAAEDIGIEHRGVFYEQAGVVRDIIQNHMMQLIALVAMEPPAGFDAEFIRDEKGKVFRTFRPMNEEDIDTFMVRGQYGPGRVNGVEVPGYRQEDNVAENSNTPTFFAGKFYLDNWRWADVPFYVRAGKRLTQRVSEIYVQYKQPPLRLFGKVGEVIEPNALILSIQPQEQICLRLNVKHPGISDQLYTVFMGFNYESSFKVKQHPAYERLLVDCIKGDLTLFARQDAIESMWSIVDPIISRWESNPAKKFPNYRSGTWGPKEAEVLIKRDDRTWRFA